MACSDIKKKKLTPKMKRFAELYVTNGNATRSYIEAYNKEVGDINSASYKLCKNEGYLLLKNEVVKEYIEELTSQRSPLAKKEWIIDKLLQIVNDPDSKDSDKIKAMDSILKCLGAYTTNQNINAKVEGTTETIIRVSIEDDEDE
ncbi:terminase small subunit [Turicibacter sp. TJ11]|uniref:terminase small subunit n=1 Tax=Turicibacter sp. TJ11 TaxID=2806443 RepID=UPI001F226135|nr:terminase small subunit [Turicibacter sp. TJ11]